MSIINPKSYANGHFELRIDTAGGAPITALIKGVEGGMLKAASVEEPQAAYHLRNRHASTREIEPLSIEFAMSGAKWALSLIEGVVNSQDHAKVSGSVVHTDFNFVEQYHYEFKQARLTEATFPKCDAKSKEYATIKTKLQPETITFKVGKGAKVPPGTTEKQKLWMCSAFNFTIDGYDSATKWTTAVEALTFKVGSKAYQTGGFKLPEIVATKIEMPKLSFTLPLSHAKPLLEWYEQSIQAEKGHQDGGQSLTSRGAASSYYERTGSLEYLDPSHKKVVYAIDFFGIGVESVSVLKSEANQAATKMVKFDCYITTAKLNVSGGKGFI